MHIGWAARPRRRRVDAVGVRPRAAANASRSVIRRSASPRNTSPTSSGSLRPSPRTSSAPCSATRPRRAARWSSQAVPRRGSAASAGGPPAGNCRSSAEVGVGWDMSRFPLGRCLASDASRSAVCGVDDRGEVGQHGRADESFRGTMRSSATPASPRTATCRRGRRSGRGARSRRRDAEHARPGRGDCRSVGVTGASCAPLRTSPARPRARSAPSCRSCCWRSAAAVQAVERRRAPCSRAATRRAVRAARRRRSLRPA